MQRKLKMASVAMATGLAIALLATPTAAVAQDEPHQEKRVHIKKIGHDDEKVIERKHKMVFIGEDGEVTRLDGDGEGMHWSTGPHGNEMVFEMGHFGPGAFLGVGTTELTPELRSHFGVSEDHGVMVSKVVDDTGAFRAGVLVGDIITAVDGAAIDSGNGLRRAIRKGEEGDAVTLEIWRDGKVQNVSAILGKTEADFAFSGGLHERVLKLDCEDDEGDCNIWMSGGDACEGDEGCEIRVNCEDDVCTCEVDGEVTDCDGLEGVHVEHHDD